MYLEKPIPDNWYSLSLSEMKQYMNGNLKVDNTSFRTKVCISEIWEVCCESSVKFLKKQDRNLIAASILNVRGWSRGYTMRFGRYGVQKGYSKM